jgi:hypothetical protein
MVDRFANVEPSVGAKWLELLKQISPGVTRAAYSTLFALLHCSIFFWPQVRSRSFAPFRPRRGHFRFTPTIGLIWTRLPPIWGMIAVITAE